MKVILLVGGKTSHCIVFATEHGSYRLKSINCGEVALYTDEGAKIVLKRGRLIETEYVVFRVSCKTWEVDASDMVDFNTQTLTASSVVAAQGQINGNGGMAITGGDGARVEGTLVATVDVIAGGKSQVHHKHPGDSRGITGEPV